MALSVKELQICDWVLCNGTPMKLNIGQIHNLVCETKWARTHKCEPIPLTEEMLKANSFEEYRDGVYQLLRYRLITDTDTIIIEPMKIESRIGNNWFWFSNKDREMEVVKPHIVYPFTYVHQLQHALRLCGLSEFADNFKVD